MPITTANDIVTEITASYKGIDQTTALNYLAMVVDEICMDHPLIHASFSLRLTANTGEYTLGSGAPWYQLGSTSTANSETIARIDTAHYLPVSGSYRDLVVTSVNELDTRDPNWRYHSSGSPSHIYATTDGTGNVVIGLYPKPDTASTPADGSGFPRVDLRARVKYGSTFTGSTVIPKAITDFDVLKHGVLYRIYQRENNGDAGLHRDNYIAARGRLYRELQMRFNANKPTSTTFNPKPRVI